jgi:ABC-2 type transport system ATP-binding protein
MTSALETEKLGRRYGTNWALRDCSLTIPTGKVVALVGPNGAGKTTLLHLAVGLLAPSTGTVHVFGHSPHEQAKTVLPMIGFVAQDHPLYRNFTVEEMNTLGRKLNPQWDNEGARARMRRKGIPLEQRVGKLSGGQQAQVALALALAKRPQLLLLDEPVASLDPVARREFLTTLGDAASGGETTVVLSSHIIGDLERVCDYLIILSASQVQLAGEIEQLRRTHRVLTVPRSEVARVAQEYTAINADMLGRQADVLVRLDGTERQPDPAWQPRDATLEEIVLAYLSQSTGSGRQGRDDGEAMPLASSGQEVTR